MAASIIREVYKLNVDNRILNNLKQQLNELIDDERSLISVPEFKSIFFTYFKDGQKSSSIYEKLLEYIKCFVVDDKVCDTEPENGDKFETMVSIQKLSKFIDVFNYYPIYVTNLRKKNDSDELTFVMTSNTRGSLV
jgi:hypothetical protein